MTQTFFTKAARFLTRIEWVNFLFIVLTPVVGVGGTIWSLQHGGSTHPTWILMVVLMFATGIGITAGYHRLFSHLTYKAHPIVETILILLGGASFEGSAREWCCAHRKHHKHVDHEEDPYNPQRGFWWSHVGWVVMKADQSDESNIKDLLKNPRVVFQDRFNIPLAVLVGMILPTLIAGLAWGDWIGGFFTAGILRIVLNHHLTFLINSFCHMFGKQNYSDTNSSRDCWWLAYLTYGEGYHNYHHTFQWDYRNGVRAYHFDPSKWLVYILSKMGLTWGIKRVDESHILAARLAMDEKRMKENRFYQWVVAHYPKLSGDEWHAFVTRRRANIESIHQRYQSLREEYIQMKATKANDMRERLTAIQHDMKMVARDFELACDQWKRMLRRQAIPLST